MIDHHAVLGFSLAAETKQVRKRYLKVARKLHPDSLREASEEERQLASELLSKQVNPAYEVLSQEKSAKEHKILLKMKQKQLSANRSLVALTSDVAKALLTENDLEASYTQSHEKLTATQFSDLTKVDNIIGQISELNAVYLMRKQQGDTTAGTTAAQAQPSGGTTAGSANGSNNEGSATAASGAVQRTTPKPSHRATIIQSYLKRAKEFESQRDYSRGILELREAIASHPKNAACHAYLSSLYLKSGQATLAKIHAKQALVFDPENETARTVQSSLGTQANKTAGKTANKTAGKATNAKKQAANSKGKANGSKKGGGLLSGLFGGKKR